MTFGPSCSELRPRYRDVAAAGVLVMSERGGIAAAPAARLIQGTLFNSKGAMAGGIGTATDAQRHAHSPGGLVGVPLAFRS